jgi:hypothetical protein
MVHVACILTQYNLQQWACKFNNVQYTTGFKTVLPTNGIYQLQIVENQYSWNWKLNVLHFYK